MAINRVMVKCHRHFNHALSSEEKEKDENYPAGKNNAVRPW